jgi:hypothetical protein
MLFKRADIFLPSNAPRTDQIAIRSRRPGAIKPCIAQKNRLRPLTALRFSAAPPAAPGMAESSRRMQAKQSLNFGHGKSGTEPKAL